MWETIRVRMNMVENCYLQPTVRALNAFKVLYTDKETLINRKDNSDVCKKVSTLINS